MHGEMLSMPCLLYQTVLWAVEYYNINCTKGVTPLRSQGRRQLFLSDMATAEGSA